VLELLGIFVNVLIPVFGVVGVGAFTARRWDLDYRPMSVIAYRVLAPAFVFRLLSDPQGLDGPVGKMVAASLGTVAAVWVFYGVLSRNSSREARVLELMSTTFGNVGNLGFPIVLFALGEDALPEAGIHFLSITVGVFFMGIVAAARLRSGTAREAFVRVATTPAIAVTPFAIGVSTTGTALPVFVARSVDLLADAMIPVMLLTLGMQLASARMTRDVRRLSRVVATKLLVAPAVFFGIASVIGLSGDGRDAGLLFAAMPTAVLVGLISLEYELETEVSTAIILVSSLAAIPSLGLLLWLM